jgi:hypothetical protein
MYKGPYRREIFSLTSFPLQTTFLFVCTAKIDTFLVREPCSKGIKSCQVLVSI